MPHKANAARRHHIPRPKRRVANWAVYDAALRQRGSLTVWFTEEAIASWRAAPRTTPGGQPAYSDLAITTALMLRAVFHQALRQTEGLIASILKLLGLDLPVPDHSTIGRRARTVRLPNPPRSTSGPLHLLVDSTGLKLCGPGEWLIEKHGTRKRRSWKKLHIGMDAASGRIVAATLTDRDEDDAAQIGPLLDQVSDPVAALTGDGAYDRMGVYAAVHERHPEATVVARPRSDAVLSDTAATAPTQRDHHIQAIAEKGRMAWQRDSRYNLRARVEGQIGRFKLVIGPALRFHTDQAQAAEVAIAVEVLNRMLGLGRPESVSIA
ncbi:IS5 family transposase [Azospirillum canadense]|uniref:IS5 family transposase n=1 Tax=Azospirillum canadense TaxID=403962 RepID=UPI002227D498|nr:IS5 family transposase [Azospirillum canadense]MCW2240418.1 IS5 family transposase [Azospirillum canadense]